VLDLLGATGAEACRECGERARAERDRLEAENAKLREMVRDVYCLAYPSTVEQEVSDAIYDKYSPCDRCKELHGGKSPCASTSEDMTEECCEPIQAAVVADHMRELGIEVESEHA
jgi:hypothetical protein